jgi:hypothetical protein
VLSKCANPSCSASFRYFHQGKLFRMETGALEDRSPGKTARRAEFYWLCDNCAPRMTLDYDRRKGVVVKPVDPGLRAAS